MDSEQIAAAERAERARRIIAYKQRHEKFKKIFYTFTSIATSFINVYFAYFVITQTMEASRGFTNYPSGVGRYCILAAFFVISFLCCGGFGTIFCSIIFILGIDDDFGDHSSPRKKRPPGTYSGHRDVPVCSPCDSNTRQKSEAVRPSNGVLLKI